MYILSKQDINKLIVACNKMILNVTDRQVKNEYSHLINRLVSYKKENFPN